MPRLPNARLVASLQHKTKALFYGDSATYYAPPSAETGLDEYGQPTYPETGTSVSCSYNDKPSKEKWGAIVDVQNVAGEIRLAGLEPNKGGRFEITGRWDESDTDPHTYEIIDIRRRGVFGFECLLKAVKI